MVLRPLPAPFPATTPTPRSSRIPTSHLRSNMLAPSRIMPGFQRLAHSSQIPAKALDPPRPMPRERTSRRSGRDPLPMHTLANVRSFHAAATGPSHIASTRAPSRSFENGTPSPNRISSKRFQGALARKNPVPSKHANTAVPAMRPISHRPSLEVQNDDDDPRAEKAIPCQIQSLINRRT